VYGSGKAWKTQGIFFSYFVATLKNQDHIFSLKTRIKVSRPHPWQSALMVCVTSKNKCVVVCMFMQSFAKMFNTTPDDLDMHVIYDVSHNIAKFEEHFVDGKQRTLLVHRKGSTRAFPPHHPLIPVDYQVCVLTDLNYHFITQLCATEIIWYAKLRLVHIKDILQNSVYVAYVL